MLSILMDGQYLLFAAIFKGEGGIKSLQPRLLSTAA